MVTMAKTSKTTPQPRQSTLYPGSGATVTDPDLVDRIFDYLLSEFPHLAGEGEQLDRARHAVREEFRGEEIYIAARPASERERLVRQVLALFNGRNATEVARRLRISRASVYRFIKQAGREQNSLTFPGTETPAAVASPEPSAPQD